MGSIELFRIGRIPIHVSFWFVALVALYTKPFWQSGNSQMISAAFVLAVGLFVSILLHELGHALAGRLFRVDTSFIELNGIGGLCHFERSLPASVVARSVIGLAGPAANLLLWLLLAQLARVEVFASGSGLVPFVLAQLAWVNKLLFIYNLLPAFPLDGGNVLAALLAPILGPIWSRRLVAVLGLLVSAWIAYYAWPGIFQLMPPSSIWMLLIAMFLGFLNYQVLSESVRR